MYGHSIRMRGGFGEPRDFSQVAGGMNCQTFCATDAAPRACLTECGTFLQAQPGWGDYIAAQRAAFERTLKSGGWRWALGIAGVVAVVGVIAAGRK